MSLTSAGPVLPTLLAGANFDPKLGDLSLARPILPKVWPRSELSDIKQRTLPMLDILPQILPQIGKGSQRLPLSL